MIELGPGGGDRGGTLVVAGPPERVAATEGSPTGRYLRSELMVEPAGENGSGGRGNDKHREVLPPFRA